MVRWRAVGFGLAVEVVLFFFGLLVPVFGHAAAGLAGGFVTGLLGGGGLRGGFEGGLVTGALGGGALALLSAAVALTVGLETTAISFIVSALGYPPAVLAGAGVALVVVGGALAGAAGGWLRGDTPLPARAGPRRGG